MPNHCCTNLTITGPASDVNSFIAAVDNSKNKEYDYFNVNGVVPIPNELKNTTAPTIIQTQEEIDAKWAEYNRKKDAGELQPWQIAEGKPSMLGITQATSDKLIAEYGFDNWYDWYLEKIGSKWGIYDASPWQFDKLNGDSDSEEIGYSTVCATISYHTAWCPATEFFITASEKFPTLTFTFEYADEGGGFVCDAVCKNGEYNENQHDWDSVEGIDIRENVGLYSPEDEENDEEENVTIDIEKYKELDNNKENLSNN